MKLSGSLEMLPCDVAFTDVACRDAHVVVEARRYRRSLLRPRDRSKRAFVGVLVGSGLNRQASVEVGDAGQIEVGRSEGAREVEVTACASGLAEPERDRAELELHIGSLAVVYILIEEPFEHLEGPLRSSCGSLDL